ncbi:MAG: preprotein translocase subunit YajC [Flavobacteriales bacterium]|nr:preprotein translocase subunit YajC [Flavobacteriales bacterium]
MNLNILLQAADAQAQNPYSFWIMMGLLMVVFYFFMIRPQQKKAKDAKKFRESLQKGARVITIGGIHGKVLEVADTTVLVEVDSNVKLRLEKSAIALDSTQQLNEASAKA